MRLILFAILVAGVLIISVVILKPKSPELTTSKATSSATPTPSSYPARQWMEYAMTIVKEEKPTPPEAARFYAYVASVYADTLSKTTSQLQASEATRKVIQDLYPTWTDKTNSTFKTITSKDATDLSDASQAIYQEYQQRETTDGFKDLQWDGVIPQGNGKWVKVNKMPYSPRAGDWKRWILPQYEKFNVPPPPTYGSAEDLKQLEIVKKAIAARDDAWNKKIIYWQGIPGTETPAGIWQNILYTESEPYHYSEADYARIQKILAQSIADSFMECWRIKYIYWTARPSMRIPGIVTSMPDPPFPSYLSGHSTISRTAAEILGTMIPDKHDRFISLAEEARDSRLYAGIHFEVDNTQGFLLGEKVGKDIVSILKL